MAADRQTTVMREELDALDQVFLREIPNKQPRD
jgi:hypothetical protein